MYNNDDHRRSYQNCTFHNPLGGKRVKIILMMCINIQHIDCICMMGLWYSLLLPLLIYLFYDGPVDMQIWALLRRSPCRVSDTSGDCSGLWASCLIWSHSFYIVHIVRAILIFFLLPIIFITHVLYNFPFANSIQYTCIQLNNQ